MKFHQKECAMKMNEIVLTHQGLELKDKVVATTDLSIDEVIRTMSVAISDSSKALRGAFITFSINRKKASVWVTFQATKKGGLFGKASRLNGRRQTKTDTTETDNDQPEGI